MDDKKKSAVKIKPDSESDKKRKAWNIVVIIVASLLCVCLVAGVIVWAVFQYYYDKTIYVADEDVTLLDESELEVYESEYANRNEDDMPENEEETLSVDLQLEYESIEEERVSVVEGIEVPTNSSSDGEGYVYNILLIGLDLRAGETWNGNSDSMILVSINTYVHEITLTSFMRDLYSIIPGVDGPKKLNYAHAKGGGPLLVETIESLYKIDIDNYASVNFYEMISIIDSLGGIDIEVTAEEASVANQYYVPYLASETGVDAANYQLTSGYVHLNGLQTVAYARIRYTSGSDYARTERQRKVLTLLFDKMKSLSLTDFNNFLNVTLPCITHNLDESTLASLIASATEYMTYTVVSNRVPYDGYYYTWNEMLVPDFEYTINMLHSQIYRTE